MPTYQYECLKCGHTFERFQSMKDEPLKRCPECRCKVRRLFGTGGGILFKGSGFYQTDYRSEGYKQAQKKDTGSSTSSDSKADTKSKKPEKAAAPKSSDPSKS